MSAPQQVQLYWSQLPADVAQKRIQSAVFQGVFWALFTWGFLTFCGGIILSVMLGAVIRH